MKVKNTHTNKTLDVVTHEIIPSYPKDIKVYILSDGSRWDAEQLWEHHIIVEE